MRTTVVLDDDLLAAAREYSSITETSALVRHALKVYVELEASRRLIAIGGTDPNAWAAPRRKPQSVRLPDA